MPAMHRMFAIWFLLAGLLGAAGLTFESELVEVKAGAGAATVNAEFRFENKTGKVVHIARYDKSCSCVGVEIAGGKLAYKPNEKGVVKMVFDVGNFSGTVDKLIVIWLEGDPDAKPSVTLTVRVHIPVLVEMDQKTLKWSIGGKGEAQKIEIRMTHEKPIRIEKVTCTSELYKTELKVVEEGRHYQLWVTPLQMDGPSLAIIRMETDCEVERHRTQQAFATVRKDPPAGATGGRP